MYTFCRCTLLIALSLVTVIKLKYTDDYEILLRTEVLHPLEVHRSIYGDGRPSLGFLSASIKLLKLVSASDLYAMHIHPLALLSLLSALAFTEPFPCEVVRYVSPTNGTNNSSCLNSTDPKKSPCKNLSFALLGKDIASEQANSTSFSRGPDNLCVYLYEGIHYLSGETQLRKTNNVLVKGFRTIGAIVRCRSFPNEVLKVWDDMSFYHSRNITVMNVIFEQCGPYGSGIYTYHVNGLHIQNCTFRYA